MWQQREDLLAVKALGTNGGELLVDGSRMQAGIHVRWDFPAPKLPFPRGGFDIYRRVHPQDEPWCGAVVPSARGIRLVGPRDGPEVRVSSSGDVDLTEACGQPNAALLHGRQHLRLQFADPAREVEIWLDARSPQPAVATAFQGSATSAVVVARATAQPTAGGLRVRLAADHVDLVVLEGTDLVVCRVCIVLVADSLDLFWPQIPLNGGTPIHLPITNPTWPGTHANQPNDHAEAADRLPAGLPTAKRSSYLDGFDSELHPILNNLVGTRPQEHAFIDHPAEGDDDRPPPTRMRWQALQLLRLLALDPNLARVLGLYWRDGEVETGLRYDYQVIGHWGVARFPGTRFDFVGLTSGRLYPAGLVYQGLRVVTPNPITVVDTVWDGRPATGLAVEPLVSGAPLLIELPAAVPSVTLLLEADAPLTVTPYAGPVALASQTTQAGADTLTFEPSHDVTSLLLDVVGSTTLIEVVTRPRAGPLGDVAYVTFDHQLGVPAVVPTPVCLAPVVAAGRSSVQADGEILQGATVGLRLVPFGTDGPSLESDAPVLFQARRASRGTGETPGTARDPTLINPDAPLVASAIPPPAIADRWLDDGWYAYQARGIDLFGRLSAWSAAQTVRVLNRVLLPPPIAVRASYLDPFDPYLADEDRPHAPGLKVSWEWPGNNRLQAPVVEAGAGQFRVYLNEGDLNVLHGQVTAVTQRASRSLLTTDIAWNATADALVGESVRVGDTYFPALVSSSGPQLQLTVDNLTFPTQVPQPGPLSLAYSPSRPYWIDYQRADSWPRLLHTEQVGPIPTLHGLVTAVSPGNAAGAVEVLTDAHLVDPQGVLTPGVLMSNGVLYRATSHVERGTLRLNITARDVPTASGEVQPSVGAAFMYYPGRRYQIYLADPGLDREPGSDIALAHLGVSTVHAAQPANESSVSVPCRVMAVDRRVPPAPSGVPAAPGQPIFALPADYFGLATYTLTWNAVSTTSGYAVYRATSAALFDRDTALRQTRGAFYASHAPFADDAGFVTWLAAAYPHLTADTLTVRAWRDWAARFYPSLDDRHVQELGDRAGNEAAFRRVNPEPLANTAFTDRFDGRGSGLYLYRVSAITVAGQPGEWSATYPPVHIFDVTPPETPVVSSLLGGERSVILSWRANREVDLAAYHIWRARSAEALADVRRRAPTAIVRPGSDGAGAREQLIDVNLVPGQRYFYRLAAIDANANVSAPTPVASARPVDTLVPQPPAWLAAAWDTQQTAIGLTWQLADASHEPLVQRQAGGVWLALTGWLAAGTTSWADRTARAFEPSAYRLRVRSASGNLSTTLPEVVVPASGGSA